MMSGIDPRPLLGGRAPGSVHWPKSGWILRQTASEYRIWHIFSL